MPLFRTFCTSFHKSSKLKEKIKKKKEKLTNDSSFNTFFKSPNADYQLHPTQNIKVSEKGTSDALFKECLDAIRKKRYEADKGVHTLMSSPKIDSLNQNEIEIIKKVFKRVQPEKQITNNENIKEHIDMFWNPFEENKNLKNEIAMQFSEYQKLVGVAEARKQKLLIRKSLRNSYKIYNPLSDENQKYFNRQSFDDYPTPEKISERFWDPNANIRNILKNKNQIITFRDLHILHNFIGENGMVLPRRLTFASRIQQRHIFKAICVARRLALFPYDFKPMNDEMIPIIDPLQYLCDELTERYIRNRDRRAKAMILVLMQKYSELNFMRFLQFEAERNLEEQKKNENNTVVNESPFYKILKKYKNANLSNNAYQPTL